MRSFGAVSFRQRRDALQKFVDGRKQEMASENADQVMDAATACLRELCPPGMEFVLIVGTTGTAGRSISFTTSLPDDQTADMMREALEMAREEDV